MKRKEEEDRFHDDPHPKHGDDPRGWTRARRRNIALIIGLFAFLEPFASSIIAPSLTTIASELHITSTVIKSLVLSSFVLPYALGTLLLAPLSEVYGRRPILLCSSVLFFAFLLACGFARTSTQLIVFRVLSGLGGCVPLAIGVAILGDLYSPAERGKPMSVYMLLQLAGPTLGPIVGGWLEQGLHAWRWSFYICAIATIVIIMLGCLFAHETYAPVLERTSRHISAPSALTSFGNLPKPFVLLTTQPILQVLSLYAAVIFGTYYLFLTTISSVYQNTYHESVGISSLHYIAMSLGFVLSAFFSGRIMDRVYKRLGEVPEARIPYLIASGTLLPVGLLVYGWTAQYRVLWLAPDVGLFLVGLGVLAPLAAIQHYVLDCYSSESASALAAMNVLRFLAGFAFPLFADKMFAALGLGWGNSLLALVAFVTASASLSLWWLGPKLRRVGVSASGEEAATKAP